jgi:iron-sulfur cluster repair protein YtfE (RIC family)
MKRIEAIAPLSRDHHTSLILAQLLKINAPNYKDLPTAANDKKEYALNHYNTHIKTHFLEEEKILEIVKNKSNVIKALCNEISEEHQQIHQLFYELKNAVDVEKTMNEIAILLEAHIRKEERILFPLLQEKCTADELGKIHQLLH